MKQTLTLDQCKALIRSISEHGSKQAKAIDHALVVSVLMCGADARTWTWQDALANPIFQPFAVYEAIKQVAISKKLSIFPYNHAGFKHAHWINTAARLHRAVFTADAKPLTTQEVTRRLKRYGKLAGISVTLMNLRTLSNSHQMYLDVFGDADTHSLRRWICCALGASRQSSRPSSRSNLKKQMRVCMGLADVQA